ncbi:MAG TPA: DUF1684 domain-containing protein [Rhodocyclaceae bacterium]|nr:DUF1684 domain-containing protein [Rhodocyclaceae bacterium]
MHEENTISLTDESRQAEVGHQRWRQRRLDELSAPDSWFGLVGLHWLEPGRNPVGSAPDCAVVLPEGPAHLGDLVWDGAFVLWQPAAGIEAVEEEGGESQSGEIMLRTDRDGEPSRVHAGNLAFFVIERDGRPAVRVRDLAWRGKRSFAGVECYPFDPAWRIEARWEELDEPWALEVQSVTGELKTINVPARARFAVAGAEYALLPLDVGDEGAFFIFRDATSGPETYGGGRFLRAKPAADGRIVLDFNRAFNPPCAFTAFATCTLAPPENRLPFAVRAGEKKYAGGY